MKKSFKDLGIEVGTMVRVKDDFDRISVAGGRGPGIAKRMKELKGKVFKVMKIDSADWATCPDLWKWIPEWLEHAEPKAAGPGPKAVVSEPESAPVEKKEIKVSSYMFNGFCDGNRICLEALLDGKVAFIAVLEDEATLARFNPEADETAKKNFGWVLEEISKDEIPEAIAKAKKFSEGVLNDSSMKEKLAADMKKSLKDMAKNRKSQKTKVITF